MGLRSMAGKPQALILLAVMTMAAGLARVATVGAAEAPAGPGAAPYLPPAGIGLTIGDALGVTEQIPVARPGMIVYTREGDVFIDDLVDDADPHRLTDMPGEAAAWAPKFVDANTVSFVSDRGLELIDLTTEVATVLAGPEPWIGSHDWSPDGSTVAYMASEWNEERQTTQSFIRLMSRTGVTTDIRHGLLLPEEGYCLHDPDGDWNLAFSPDGRWLLFENVAAYPAPAVTVLAVDGTVVLEPSHLAWALFDQDSTLIARDIAAKEWVRLSLGSGRVESVPVPVASRRPALAPGKGSIAFDDGVGAVTIVDLADGDAPRTIDGYIDPIWLDHDRLIAFAADACDGCDIADSNGNATLFDLDGGERRLTIERFAQIDVLR